MKGIVHSLPAGCGMKIDETAQLMGVWCHSLSVGHRIRDDDVAWWKN